MSSLTRSWLHSWQWITYAIGTSPPGYGYLSWNMYFRTVHEMQARVYCDSSALDCDSGYHQKERTEYLHPSRQNQCVHSPLFTLGKQLKNVDLIDGRLAKIEDNSFVFDVDTKHEIQELKCLARNFIGCMLPVHDSWKLAGSNNLHKSFAEPSERYSITFDSLKAVCKYLGLSVGQRRSVREIISSQVIQYGILRKTLNELVRELDTDLGVIDKPSKKVQAGKEATAKCMQLLSESFFLPESSSWAKLTSHENLHLPKSKWGDVLESFEVISDVFNNVESLEFYVRKIDGLKEGLSHIRDIQLDNNIGFQKMRHRESLVKFKLQNLGHTSECLFTLLVFYLFENVRNITVDTAGGLYGGRHKKFLWMGEIITSPDQKMLWRAIKHLDKAFGLVKFIYEIAGTSENLKLEGHIWTFGAQENMIQYRGNSFFVHGIECE